MKLKVQLVICAEDQRPDTIHDVAVLEKDCHRIEQLGLTLAEAKQILTQLQQYMVARQAGVFVEMRSRCEACGALLPRKEVHEHADEVHLPGVWAQGVGEAQYRAGLRGVSNRLGSRSVEGDELGRNTPGRALRSALTAARPSVHAPPCVALRWPIEGQTHG